MVLHVPWAFSGSLAGCVNLLEEFGPVLDELAGFLLGVNKGSVDGDFEVAGFASIGRQFVGEDTNSALVNQLLHAVVGELAVASCAAVLDVELVGTVVVGNSGHVCVFENDYKPNQSHPI